MSINLVVEIKEGKTIIISDAGVGEVEVTLKDGTIIKANARKGVHSLTGKIPERMQGCYIHDNPFPCKDCGGV